MAAATISHSSSSDTNPIPSMTEPLSHPPAAEALHLSIPDSASSSTAPSDNKHDSMWQASLPPRPKLNSRQSSGTNIVPVTHPCVETRNEAYTPSDARAMSPRRSSEETDRLSQETRRVVQEHARILQSGLSALAERIEAVKADHDRLEKQNAALQDYIGGLTRSMSSTSAKSKK